ncbi:carboxymuconolactone decarboxylase family protein [Paenibacillus whitsoniae]|uniref:carboxymuconolactone decarboxylase family protein n=1 Tax=Paenibacillus whitsoniae TaxID=2496558 RepID=UPI0024083D58|nr:carboxymuconolactone decarboxylase family protein [Paenibacillus whitsoniae]
MPSRTLFLMYLRASQINGDSACVELHSRNAMAAGESKERVLAVSAWREANGFDAAERAALALSEAVTRLSDQDNPVSDEIFDEAARHFDETALATLIAGIATANLWNRFNVSTRQLPAGPAAK